VSIQNSDLHTRALRLALIKRQASTIQLLIWEPAAVRFAPLPNLDALVGAMVALVVLRTTVRDAHEHDCSKYVAAFRNRPGVI